MCIFRDNNKTWLVKLRLQSFLVLDTMEPWRCYSLLGVSSRTPTKQIRMRINKLRTQFAHVKDSKKKKNQLETLRKIENYFEKENFENDNYEFVNEEWKKNWMCLNCEETNRSRAQKASFFGRSLNLKKLKKSPAKVYTIYFPQIITIILLTCHG